MQRLTLLIAVALGFSRVAYSQSPDSAGAGEIIVADIQGALYDAGRFFTAPLRFDASDWITAGAVVAGTVASMAVDTPGRSLARRNHGSFGDDLFSFGREYGRKTYGMVLAGGLYAGGLAFRSREVRETGVMLMESMVFAAAVMTVVKSVMGRSRPYLEEGPWMFRPFQTAGERTSLPSGHATQAFAVSSVLAARLRQPVVTVTLYGAACITALSRIYHDAHWFSDTLLGAAIGTATGLAVAAYHRNGEDHCQVYVIPGGLSIVWAL